jgi:ribosomal protein S18 acetylase RimI-like enzyme
VSGTDPVVGAAARGRKATWYIRQAASMRDLAAARDLFREYQEWLAVDLCFQGFAAELASLPGAYAPPRGRLLLAERIDAPGEVAGCVALRPLDERRCEMKRLFVRPEHQGAGIGRRLVDRLIAEATAIGYRSMVLDTLPKMASAQRLYASLGFRDIDAYYHNPTPGVRYLGLDLAGA